MNQSVRSRSGASSRRTAVLVLLLGAAPLSAQDLPFQRASAGAAASSCPAFERPARGSAEGRTQAAQLASTAEQSVILGDLARALPLLERATELDPASPDLAYRRARALEASGDTEGAIIEYCRMIALPDEGVTDQDPRIRLEAIEGAERARFPEEAIVAFEEGLAAVDRERHRAAAEAFGAARRHAPLWAGAVYNQGIALDRAGSNGEAAEALLRYLELRPGAPDAIAVSQRIGQLQSLAIGGGRSPGAALTLGTLVPGMGQFYSGRPIGGLMVLVLAGGAAAAGFLLEEVHIRCLDADEPGGNCPSDQVVSRSTDRPYLMLGIGVAAAVGVIGAVEAFVHLRGRRSDARSFTTEGSRRDATSGPVLERPSLSTSSGAGRLDLNVLRLRFR